MASNKKKLDEAEYQKRLSEFSKRLKKERKKLKISQDKLAKRAGLSSHAVISRWEAVADKNRNVEFTSKGAVAREFPDVNDMLKLCKVFGCDIAYLLGEQELPTKAATDIKSVIGLTEKAIEKLSDMPDVPNLLDSDEPYELDLDVPYDEELIKLFNCRAETNSYRTIINILLLDPLGNEALQTLANYFLIMFDKSKIEEISHAYALMYGKNDKMLKNMIVSEKMLCENILQIATDKFRELREKRTKANQLLWEE